jgi:hypothetical protein
MEALQWPTHTVRELQGFVGASKAHVTFYVGRVASLTLDKEDYGRLELYENDWVVQDPATPGKGPAVFTNEEFLREWEPNEEQEVAYAEAYELRNPVVDELYGQALSAMRSYAFDNNASTEEPKTCLLDDDDMRDVESCPVCGADVLQDEETLAKHQDWHESLLRAVIQIYN